MKAIRLKTPNYKLKIDELFSLLKYNGFSISNPDNKDGEYLDIIVKDGNRIAGMDLLISAEGTYPVFYADELYLITDWIEDHGQPNTTR